MAGRVKHITLMGKTRELDESLQETDGYCDDDTIAIRHRPRQTELRLLTLYIHEFLHACFPATTEAHTEQAGADIARALWRLGYRGRKND